MSMTFKVVSAGNAGIEHGCLSTQEEFPLGNTNIISPFPFQVDVCICGQFS